MPKKILISVGPIPARLDSVKFVTNRFKGGLALKTAQFLADSGNDVTIIAWQFAELTTALPIIRCLDVMDYFEKVMAFEADAYVLAAAVANLMPSNPYEGKFPSHLYAVGEKFNVEFEIAPRVIDTIKKLRPRSTLIGYKLYDGTDSELIKAGKTTLFESKANLVFANHPQWAKSKKMVLTQDGAEFICNFEEHCALIHKLVNAKFYTTKIQEPANTKLSEAEQQVFNTYPVFEKDGRQYGTVAIRRTDSFLTTTRGKQQGRQAYSEIYQVDHAAREVIASSKATLNAPLLAKVFEINPQFKILLHGHQLKGKQVHPAYEFPGTTEDLNFAVPAKAGEEILLTQHGFLVGFEEFEQYLDYLRKG